MRFLSLWFLILLMQPVSAVADALVGLLGSDNPLYEKENMFATTSKAMIESYGANVVVIDYNLLVKQSGDLGANVKKFIKDARIRKVFIPGSFYNFDKPPLHPNNNRLNVIKVLVELSRNKELALVGICGGLQAVMHAQGIKIKRVDEEVLGNHLKDFELYSDSLHKDPASVMNLIKLDPSSKIISVMRPDPKLYDENGWVRLSMPDTHSEAVLRDEGNLKKLSDLGYRVVGISSEDGVVEIIEDAYGNYFFQGHPDGLVLLHATHSGYKDIPEEIRLSVDALKRFWRAFFLS